MIFPSESEKQFWLHLVGVHVKFWPATQLQHHNFATHYGLETSYGDIDLDQYLLR